MVASASNNLDIEGTGGYVALPALCANVISVGSVDASGVPSDFSSYKTKNDVYSNPNIVAVGQHRLVDGFGGKTGTSFSAPAVTGAIAMFFEKTGVQDLPAMLAVLSATADDSVVYKGSQNINMLQQNPDSGEYEPSGEVITCTNNLKSNGSRERTGAGALDVTALMNYSNGFISYGIIYPSSDYYNLRDIYLTSGQTVKISLAWDRNATLTIEKFLWWETGRYYSSDALADFDLYLFERNGAGLDSSSASQTNVEILTYTVSTTGYYTIKLKPYSNYSSTRNIYFAYVVE